MPNLYALLIGINDYAGISKLSKAVDDANKMESFLKKQLGSSLKLKKLTDSQATRNGIIHGFKHFKSAGSSDICLLYFSGHGSQVEPPSGWESKYNEGDFESVVCYDSRQAGGYDLVDKELAYLIWENTRQAGHLCVIMDCCHSGDNTREEDDVAGAIKTAAPYLGDKDVSAYYGYNPGSTYPPKRSHVLLAACQSNSTARDGVFTSYLLHVLESDFDESYRSIFDKLKSKLSQNGIKQSPYLSSSGLESKVFLKN
ncbi:MAG TPA: caspase family protein [Saprospiraceae bacterium]|nr:caspase family protein [Saprospiraceae bacterium]HMQ82598.1 caspase family protein [Saprospiraceae bacterium]